jgi:hypothetical protein
MTTEGHFAGWERPDALAEALSETFGKGGGAAGVVEGRIVVIELCNINGKSEMLSS